MKGLAGIEQPPSRRDFSSEPPKTQTEKKNIFPINFLPKISMHHREKKSREFIKIFTKRKLLCFFFSKIPQLIF